MSPFTRLFAIISVVVTTGAVAVNNTKNSGTVKFLEVTADDFPSPAVNPVPQDFTVGEVWTEINFDGEAAFMPVTGIPSSCFNILAGSDFDNTISSIGVISGISCTFFVDPKCKGASVTVQNNIFAPNLGGTNFDDSISSFQCFAA